ncbi:MAG TPA: hypothetical protein VG055_14110 [Planctomycetaceae bacterium]|nr:hypothetical protein [Planctomycetaceae bacterium]
MAVHDFGLAPREENTVGRASRGLKKRGRERLDARLMISQMASDARKDDSSRIFARLRRFLRDGISRAHTGWNHTRHKQRLGCNVGLRIPEPDTKHSQPP